MALTDSQTRYTHDAQDNLTSATDPTGLTTFYTYYELDCAELEAKTADFYF